MAQQNIAKVHVPGCQLTIGERFFFAAYGQVVGFANDKANVVMDHGANWSISKNIFDQKVFSASYVSKTERVSRTKLAQLLHHAGQNIFRVVFKKANGETRALIGHLVDSEELMGRASVVDLEVAAGEHNLRQVDYRTLEELTLCGVKYVLK